jgi:hypothetical protein
MTGTRNTRKQQHNETVEGDGWLSERDGWLSNEDGWLSREMCG